MSFTSMALGRMGFARHSLRFGVAGKHRVTLHSPRDVGTFTRFDFKPFGKGESRWK